MQTSVVPSHRPEAVAAPENVSRRAHYFGADGEILFGWLHQSTRAIPRDCAAVLCAPIGPEYTRSHRAVRHLADRLASAGVPALRFDYQGCGDSAGAEDAPARLDAWRRSVAAAVWHARRVTGCSRVCLIGLRLGATLAALEAEGTGADLVVLWNPVTKGRTYVRELQAISRTAADGAAPQPGDGIDSAGFRISGETLEALKAIELTRARFKRGARVMLAVRDDMASDGGLQAHLVQAGVPHDLAPLPGWNGMMADHQFTVIPDAALNAIVDWVRAHSVARPAVTRPTTPPGSERLALDGMNEEVVRFGSDGHLFGVLAEPAESKDLPTVVLLNAGSIHHVGPSRLYVRIARELGALGFPSLRMDHEGLGDSVLRGAGVENEPYAETAMEDLEAAFALLKARGHRRFVLLGLCSGAHTAFHAARQFEGEPIERAVLINPWYFYWQAGTTYDPDCHHFENVVNYQKSMRDPDRWKRLLRGDIDFKRVGKMASILAAQAGRKAKALASELREIVSPASGTRLSRDLRTVFAQGRRLSMYESDGEPAGAVLLTEARRTYARAHRSGFMTLENVRGGDHTFSQSAARSEIIRRITEELRRHYLKEAP